MRTNNANQLHRAYERALARIEELERENSEIPELRRIIAEQAAEIERLNAKIADFDRVLEETVARAVAEVVKAATEPLLAEISRLKAIINKDSGNSSAPPSRSGFKKRIDKVNTGLHERSKKFAVSWLTYELCKACGR
ncbi:MAG: DUF3450 domain-containing protein, partial [Oscillospiraceae bacterium]|nr:DUF3450 domain-containing protein [Oscillospiraceae bacterium]